MMRQGSENAPLLKSNDASTEAGDEPCNMREVPPRMRMMMAKQGSNRSMQKQLSSRALFARSDSGLTQKQLSSRNVFARSDSGLSGNVKRQNSQDLLMGALDASETMTESSVGSASGKSPTSAALPESISWRVANSWKLVEPKIDYIGVEFFLNLFAEHPQAADLFHFGKHVMYLGEDKKKRHDNVPKSLKVHARKVCHGNIGS